MAKKLKSPPKTGINDSKTGPYFQTLFGEIPEQHSFSNSLFSDNNPFRRKLQENPAQERDLGPGFGAKDVENEGTLEDSDPAELKENKKRKKEKVENGSSNLDAESVEGENNKKQKTGESKIPERIEYSNVDITGDGGTGETGVENRKKKKKNKRKRNEVEAEYEGIYGVADGNENVGGSDVVGGKRKKLDNPEDTMVSKEGFDDESKLLRTVFVGNLPPKTKKKVLLKEFGKFGEVESVRIRSVPIVDGNITRKGSVIQKRFNENGGSILAYIVFMTEDSAQASLTLNMAVIGGNRIRVDRARPPHKKLKGDHSPLLDNKRTVFVGNLPFDVKDEEIYQLFCGIKNLECSIEAVRVIRDAGTSLGKGNAYVLFKTKDAADSILILRNLKLRGRKIRLSRSSDTPLKRKSSSTPETENYPAKKFAVNSRTPESGVMVNSKENLQYQGIRASKSGSQKKTVPRARTKKDESKIEPAMEQKSTKKKQPAVAAREKEAQKAARKMESNGSASGSKLPIGTKRKFGNLTPESVGQNKKARKLR